MHCWIADFRSIGYLWQISRHAYGIRQGHQNRRSFRHRHSTRTSGFKSSVRCTFIPVEYQTFSDRIMVARHGLYQIRWRWWCNGALRGKLGRNRRLLCQADMKIMREEVFGPVGAVIKFENDEGIFYLFFAAFLPIFTLLLTDII